MVLCYVDGTDLPKPQMLENIDFVLLPEDAWKKLIKWYSLQNGQVLYLLLQPQRCSRFVRDSLPLGDSSLL